MTETPDAGTAAAAPEAAMSLLYEVLEFEPSLPLRDDAARRAPSSAVEHFYHVIWPRLRTLSALHPTLRWASALAGLVVPPPTLVAQLAGAAPYQLCPSPTGRAVAVALPGGVWLRHHSDGFRGAEFDEQPDVPDWPAPAGALPVVEWCLCWSADGQTLAVSTGGGECALLSNEGEELQELAAPATAPAAIAFWEELAGKDKKGKVRGARSLLWLGRGGDLRCVVPRGDGEGWAAAALLTQCVAVGAGVGACLAVDAERRRVFVGGSAELQPMISCWRVPKYVRAGTPAEMSCDWRRTVTELPAAAGGAAAEQVCVQLTLNPATQGGAESGAGQLLGRDSAGRLWHCGAASGDSELKAIDSAHTFTSAAWWGDALLMLASSSGNVTIQGCDDETNLMAGRNPEEFETGATLATVWEESSRGGSAAASSFIASVVAAEDAASPQRLSLYAIKQQTPVQQLEMYVSKKEYGSALSIAGAYRLNTDLVRKAQWLGMDVSDHSNRDYLAKVMEKGWALEQVLARVCDSAKQSKALLAYGFELTELPELKEYVQQLVAAAAADAGSDSEDGGASAAAAPVAPVLDAEAKQKYRWRLLYKEREQRLMTYQEFSRGFSKTKFHEFASAELLEYAERFVATVEGGTSKANQVAHVNGVEALLQHHPTLRPHLLELIRQMPEFVSPTQYKDLLPSIGAGAGLKTKEWLHTPGAVKGLCDYTRRPEALELFLAGSQDGAVRGDSEFASDVIFPSLRDWSAQHVSELQAAEEAKAAVMEARVLGAWYAERAKEIDERAMLLGEARQLLRAGAGKGAAGPEYEAVRISTNQLNGLVMSQAATADAQLFTLERWCALGDEERLQRLLHSLTIENVVSQEEGIQSESILSLIQANPEEFLKWLGSKSEEDLTMAKVIFQWHAEGSTDERVVRQLNEIGAVGNDTQLIELALSCIYAYNKPFGKDCEDQMTDIFESLPMRVKEGERKFDRQEHGKRYQNVQTQVDDLDDVMTAARVFSKWGLSTKLHTLQGKDGQHEGLNEAKAKELMQQFTGQLKDFAPSGDVSRSPGKKPKESKTIARDLVKDALFLQKSLLKGWMMTTAEVALCCFGAMLRNGFFESAQELLVNEAWVQDIVDGPETEEESIRRQLSNRGPVIRTSSVETGLLIKGSGAAKSAQLVMDVSLEIVDSVDALKGCWAELQAAKRCLAVGRDQFTTLLDQVQIESDLIDAMRELSTYNLPRTVKTLQVRECEDRTELIYEIMEGEPEAYKEINQLLEIASLLGLSRKDQQLAIRKHVAERAWKAKDVMLATEQCVKLAEADFSPGAEICGKVGTELAEQRERKRDFLTSLAGGKQAKESAPQLLLFAAQNCQADQINDFLQCWHRTTEAAQSSMSARLGATSVKDTLEGGKHALLAAAGAAEAIGGILSEKAIDAMTPTWVKAEAGDEPADDAGDEASAAESGDAPVEFPFPRHPIYAESEAERLHMERLQREAVPPLPTGAYAVRDVREYVHAMLRVDLPLVLGLLYSLPEPKDVDRILMFPKNRDDPASLAAERATNPPLVHSLALADVALQAHCMRLLLAESLALGTLYLDSAAFTFTMDEIKTKGFAAARRVEAKSTDGEEGDITAENLRFCAKRIAEYRLKRDEMALDDVCDGAGVMQVQFKEDEDYRQVQIERLVKSGKEQLARDVCRVLQQPDWPVFAAIAVRVIQRGESEELLEAAVQALLDDPAAGPKVIVATLEAVLAGADSLESNALHRCYSCVSKHASDGDVLREAKRHGKNLASMIKAPPEFHATVRYGALQCASHARGARFTAGASAALCTAIETEIRNCNAPDPRGQALQDISAAMEGIELGTEGTSMVVTKSDVYEVFLRNAYRNAAAAQLIDTEWGGLFKLCKKMETNSVLYFLAEEICASDEDRVGPALQVDTIVKLLDEGTKLVEASIKSNAARKGKGKKSKHATGAEASIEATLSTVQSRLKYSKALQKLKVEGQEEEDADGRGEMAWVEMLAEAGTDTDHIKAEIVHAVACGIPEEILSLAIDLPKKLGATMSYSEAFGEAAAVLLGEFEPESEAEERQALLCALSAALDAGAGNDDDDNEDDDAADEAVLSQPSAAWPPTSSSDAAAALMLSLMPLLRAVDDEEAISHVLSKLRADGSALALAAMQSMCSEGGEEWELQAEERELLLACARRVLLLAPPSDARSSAADEALVRATVARDGPAVREAAAFVALVAAGADDDATATHALWLALLGSVVQLPEASRVQAAELAKLAVERHGLANLSTQGLATLVEACESAGAGALGLCLGFGWPAATHATAHDAAIARMLSMEAALPWPSAQSRLALQALLALDGGRAHEVVKSPLFEQLSLVAADAPCEQFNAVVFATVLERRLPAHAGLLVLVRERAPPALCGVKAALSAVGRWCAEHEEQPLEALAVLKELAAV